MKIGFVAEPYEEKNASGMGYVVIEFLKNLPLRPEDTLVVYSSKPVSKEVIPQRFTNTIITKGFFKKLFYFWRLKDDIDVLIFMTPLLPIVAPRRVKTVLVFQEVSSQKTPVHGLREHLLAFTRDRMLMHWCIARAAKVIAASHATKTDIHTYYNVPDQKVVVVYDGFQDMSVYKDSAPAVEEKMKPFFFFAGKVKTRKNVHGIVSGFIWFKEHMQSDAKLVIAGDYGGEYYKQIESEIKAHKLEHEIFFVGYAVGAGLYSFYKDALAFVFPSFNEGFGMPPVEAMSLGTPVITSNLSSMAEVVAHAGLLVNPHDASDIGKAMERIYTEPDLRADLIAKGLERSKEFSWSKAGLELMGILRSL